MEITIEKSTNTVIFNNGSDVFVGSLRHLQNIIAHNTASLGDDDYSALYQKELMMLDNDDYLISELMSLHIEDIELSSKQS